MPDIIAPTLAERSPRITPARAPAGLRRTPPVAPLPAHTAVLIAVATSLANTLARRRTAEAGDVDAIRIWLPHGLPAALAGTALAQRLDLASRLTTHLAARGGSAAVDATPLADAWRRTCRAALAVVGLGRPGTVPADQEIRNAAALLAVSAAGGSPCVESDGGIAIPSWAERRRSGRTPADLAVTVLVQGKALPATLTDAAPGGLGLAVAETLASGDLVAVRLADGRLLAGTIAWWRDGRAGLQLEQPLEPGDALLLDLVP